MELIPYAKGTDEQPASPPAPALVHETDRDGCSCGHACPGCGNCRALATGCGWCRCDGDGLVLAEGSGVAIQAAETRARLRRRRRAW